MVNGSPLFPGRSETDQLCRILKVLGTPTLKQWPALAEMPDFKGEVTPPIAAVPLKHIVPRLDINGVNLLSVLFFSSSSSLNWCLCSECSNMTPHVASRPTLH